MRVLPFVGCCVEEVLSCVFDLPEASVLEGNTCVLWRSGTEMPKLSAL